MPALNRPLKAREPAGSKSRTAATGAALSRLVGIGSGWRRGRIHGFARPPVPF